MQGSSLKQLIGVPIDKRSFCSAALPSTMTSCFSLWCVTAVYFKVPKVDQLPVQLCSLLYSVSDPLMRHWSIHSELCLCKPDYCHQYWMSFSLTSSALICNPSWGGENKIHTCLQLEVSKVTQTAVVFILYTRGQSPDGEGGVKVCRTQGEGGEMINWGYAENDFYIINHLWHYLAISIFFVN